MKTTDQRWKKWGIRLRADWRERGITTPAAAEAMGLAESTVRSWLNGTRDPNLNDFFDLCEKTGADPMMILFSRPLLSQEEKEELGKAIVSVLESDASANPHYASLIRKFQKARRKAK